MSEQTPHEPPLGSPPDGWRLARLDELTTKIGSGATPKGGSESYLPTRQTYALIRSQNVFDNRFHADGLAFISDEQAAALRGAEVRRGDLLLNITGDGVTFGRVCSAPEHSLPACVNQHVTIVRVDQSQCVAGYLLGYLTLPRVKQYIESFNAGGSRRAITKGHISSFLIPLPPLREQQQIAEIVDAINDKIEQNRRTGAKLEGLARAVFKAWFVDFEPVKAKAAGATAFPGMPPETFAALPTRLTNSELGPVPQGWEDCRQRVSDLERAGTLLIGDGYRAKRSELADFGVPFIRAGNVNGTIITDGAELLGKPAIEKAGVKRSQVWDTVFTSKGTVGRIGLVTPATGDVVYAPQVCFWRAMNREALCPFLLHLWMKSESFTCQWMSVKGQTDMADFVSLSDQRAMTMLVPPPEVQRGFDNIVRPIVELLAESASESAKLAALRDYLLPRLLSGRVRVQSVSCSPEPKEVP